MTLNPWMKAGLGLGFALLWSCPTLAAMTAEKNFGLDVKDRKSTRLNSSHT